MPTTTNFGWTTPADTDLVKDGAAAIRTLGSNIDTSLVDLKGGTTGQYLKKNSGTDLDYVWGDISAGGMTLLSTTTLSGASTTISGISGSYKELLFIIDEIYPSASAFAWYRLNGNSSSNYDEGGLEFNWSAGTSSQRRNSGTEFYLTPNTGLRADYTYAAGNINIKNYTSTTSRKTVTDALTYIGASNNRVGHFGFNYFNAAEAAITSITFGLSTGTFTAGTIKTYGVN